MDVLRWLHQELEAADENLPRAMAETLMSAEVSSRCNAGHGERTPEWQPARNDCRTRRWDARVSTIDLAIPKLRQGNPFPAWLLAPRRPLEQALVAVVAEVYLLGRFPSYASRIRSRRSGPPTSRSRRSPS